jgi:putative redox protein
MKIKLDWTGKFRFTATDGTNSATMDTKPPYGEGFLTPKQLCLAAIEGCTGMDVISHLNKREQLPRSFCVEADADLTETHPKIFTEVRLDFLVDGEVQAALLLEAVQLSQTKYCGVSAMMAKNCPIRYRVFLNGSQVGQGEARF